jgi:hypothetical protein
MTQFALPFEPDSMIQLVVGMVRQLPAEHIIRHLQSPVASNSIQEKRQDVVQNLLNLKRSLTALDEALGANPSRFERP